jgi:hypothetical protein
MEESVTDADAALALCSEAGDLEGRCMALDMVAAHAGYFGDLDRAQAVAFEQLALAERLGDPFHIAVAVMRQCWCAGDLRAKRAFADEAVPLLRRCGYLYGIHEMFTGMACLALVEGDYETAAETAGEALRAAEETGEPIGLAFAYGNAALAALCLERLEEAERLFYMQIEVCRRERIDMLWPEPATGLACIAARAGVAERAATMLGFAAAVPSLPWTEGDIALHARLVAKYITPAREALGECAWKRAAATGAAMTPDQLCEFALDRRVRAGAG